MGKDKNAEAVMSDSDTDPRDAQRAVEDDEAQQTEG